MQIDNVSFQQDVNGSWQLKPAAAPHHILLIVLRGQVEYQFGDSVARIRKGEGLFYPQGTVRSAQADRTEPLQLYSAHFRCEPSSEIALLASEPYQHLKPLGFDYLKQRFSVLHECWIGRLESFDLISRGILMEILGIVQRDLAGGKGSPARRSLALRIQQYIVQRYRHPLRLPELADAVGRSPNYVSTVFREMTGKSPVEYLHEVRISAARELLMTTNMTIGEIAEFLGYCDQTYFNVMYKKIVGHPPSHTLKIRSPE